MALPKLGITEEVRACEGCYLRQQSPGEIPSSKPPSRSGPTEDILSKEEEELEKAIAASLESAAPSSKKKSSSKKLKKQVSFKDAKPVDEDEEDADLKAAIEASLKESQPASRDFNKRDESIPSYPLSYEPQPIYEDVQAYKTPSFEPSNLAPPKPTQAQPQLQVQQVELLSQREMDNLRLFAELVEKTDADLALRGIHTLNRAQLEVRFCFLRLCGNFSLIIIWYRTRTILLSVCTQSSTRP